jgi:hypothetical protein
MRKEMLDIFLRRGSYTSQNLLRLVISVSSVAYAIISFLYFAVKRILCLCFFRAVVIIYISISVVAVLWNCG